MKLEIIRKSRIVPKTHIMPFHQIKMKEDSVAIKFIVASTELKKKRRKATKLQIVVY